MIEFIENKDTTDLLIDSLVLEMMRSVSSVKSHLVFTRTIIINLEPDSRLVILSITLMIIIVSTLHTHTPAASTASQTTVTTNQR